MEKQCKYGRLVIVPGKGCGATKPMRPLNSDDIDGMVSTSDVECGTIRTDVRVRTNIKKNCVGVLSVVVYRMVPP